jgi:hypothetical protein
MSIIPLALQKKIEQRWAARFAQRAPLTAPQDHRPERHLATPIKVERKARRAEVASLKPTSDV